MQYAAECCSLSVCRSVLQFVSVMQCVTVRYSALQFVAVRCRVTVCISLGCIVVSGVVQCVTVWQSVRCSVLQCDPVRCSVSVSLHVAQMYISYLCSVLQCNAVRCSVLHCMSLRCSYLFTKKKTGRAWTDMGCLFVCVYEFFSIFFLNHTGFRGSDCSVECPGGAHNPCSGFFISLQKNIHRYFFLDLAGFRGADIS